MLELSRDREWHSCLRKNRYETYLEALEKAREAAKRTNSRIVAYECEFGDHYHIGHSPKPETLDCPICKQPVPFDDYDWHRYTEHGVL